MSENSPLGVSDLLRRLAATSPDHLGLVFETTRMTWAELDGAVTRAALALLAAGATDGDRISLQLPTSADFVLGYLGALRAGLVAVPVNSAYTSAETEQILGDAGAKLHLTSETAATLFGHAPSGADPQRDRGGEALALLLYTSGTSGRPRGAMLSARALLANLDQVAAVRPPLLRAEDVLFVPLPLSHVFGLNAGLGMALRVGATLVLAGRFDPAESLAIMAAERVTAVVGVPGQYAAWLQQPEVADGFARVRFAMSGSATLSRALVIGFRGLGVPLHDGYGLTEAAPVVSVNTVGAGVGNPVPGSIGRPLPGIEVRLRDLDGAPVDEHGGDPGRVFVRGANLFSGYWPGGEDGPDEHGWFGTGDIAVMDADRALHLVGRSAELVIVNGFNVYPAEVEAVIAALPGVAEVAVVGVPDARTGEAVHAYAVPVSGATLDPDALLAAAAVSLARFKLPERIEVVAALPHTVTGKIMKWQLDGTASASGSV